MFSMQHSWTRLGAEGGACAAGDRTSSTSLGTFARLGGNGVDCMSAFLTAYGPLWRTASKVGLVRGIGYATGMQQV